jgi:signal transduction histidine kinase
LIRDSDGKPQFAIDMVEDITERQRAAAALATSRRRLAASRETERLHLARELHDGPVQDLIAISFQLAKRRSPAGAAQRTAEPDNAVDGERQRVLAVVAQLRGLIGELRPPGLTEFGLPTALRGYVARLQRDEGDGLPAIVLDLDEQAAGLPQSLALTLFRIVQEALRNVIRHAQAQEITVSLRREPSEVELQVRDDGRGFRVPDRLNELAHAGHFGLVGLAERVEQADGKFSVTSSAGSGTTIAVCLPIVEVRDDDERADSRAAR